MQTDLILRVPIVGTNSLLGTFSKSLIDSGSESTTINEVHFICNDIRLTNWELKQELKVLHELYVEQRFSIVEKKTFT